MLKEGDSTAAAESYVRDRLEKFPFPDSPNQFRLLMEIAFIEGAQWYNEQRIKQTQTELDTLNKEAAHA